MIGNQEIIKKIRSFGLNTYEAKIWAALLSRGVSTAGELSDIANVPRSRSYDVLESLKKKGFVEMKLGKPMKYLAVPPKEVLENVKRAIEKNTEKHISEIKNESFTNLINTFQELHEKNTNKIDSIVAVLRGRKNIYKHLNFLFNNTKKNTSFLVKNDTGSLEIIDNTKNKGKTSKILPIDGIMMYLDDDDNTIIFPIQEREIHPDYDLGIWIKDKQTTYFLRHLLNPY